MPTKPIPSPCRTRVSITYKESNEVLAGLKEHVSFIVDVEAEDLLGDALRAHLMRLKCMDHSSK